MAVSPYLGVNDQKKHWWVRNRKLVEKYVKDARNLIATQEQDDIVSALGLLDAALAVSPRLETALELKARCLLQLRRFKDVADMLQEYIPTLKMSTDDSASVYSDNSSQPFSRERLKLLPSNYSSSPSPACACDPSFKCFSVLDLKKKLMVGLSKNCDREGQWRYLVLGQACCHLGLMEDAMALLQTGKRLASAAFRRESICWSDDSFSLPTAINTSDISSTTAPTTPPSTPPRNPTSISEYENISQLLSYIKFLVRRRTAAIAALDAGLYSEAIRHFSKIVEGRRLSPQGFLAECYMHRASAYMASGRIAEAIADCNKTLALDPSCIQALDTRASLLETIRCLPDCLHDLEHLKLLYNSILRDRKLPGPAWKRHNVRCREIPGKLCALTTRIQRLKQRVASGETENIDYYALMGLSRGCSRSELERAHLLLCLRHKPDNATNFLDRCQFADDLDLGSVKDRAKMSALLLYRLLQKGHSSVMSTIMDEEAAIKKKKADGALHEAKHATKTQNLGPKLEPEANLSSDVSASNTCNANAFQGVYCRDLVVVRNLLSQVGFNRQLPMKYEALSC